ncbi:MAG: RibD family protein [Methanothrix sp.]|nr:RibD family protein [Methanothrix sp.]
MLPKVILHNAVSLDGRIDGFPIDLFQYYELIATWKEDATLAGSHTFLKANSDSPPEDESAFLPPRIDPGDSRALLAIPDSRGRIRTWHYLRSLPYWRGFVALCSQSTPQEYLDYLKERHIDYIIAGQDHVDLRAALQELHSRYGVKVVRVDAGGTLNGQLLRQGLVSEVSLLLYPSLVGGERQSSIFRAPDLQDIAATAATASTAATDLLTGPEDVISLKLMQMERLKGDVIWLRYEVK